MFEKHKEKKTAEEYQTALRQWQAADQSYTEMLDAAKSFNGTTSDQLMLGSGEALFLTVANCALVEDRVTGGHWQGGSTGVSIPIGSIGGRSIRYRVGASRGHYIQGTPTPTAIDRGSVHITNQRVVFQGAKQTRECQFSKLIGFQHDDAAGTTTFSVSNRQKAITVAYGKGAAATFDFRLDLALAHFKGTVDQLVAGLEQDLQTIASEKPLAPTTLGS